MELSTVRESFEHVAKKQKLSSTRCHEIVDTLSHEIEQALATVQSDKGPTLLDNTSILTQLKMKLHEFGSQRELETMQKELNTNFTKYTKLLEKVFSPDISKAYKNVDSDVQTINEIVSNYFFRQGLFDIGDCLMKEAGGPESNALRTHFLEMYQILRSVRSKNIQPALKWVSANCEKLRQNGSTLELKLHQLQYVELLKQGDQNVALRYARTYITPLAPPLDVLEKVMTCLLWIGKLEKCPYTEILSPDNWDKVADELSREFCVMLDQPSRPALEVTLEAGFEGLPTLLKLANLVAAKPHEWELMKQFSTPIELSKGLQFHSVFVCPVSKDEGTADNPPMLLPCGHVLCKQSITKMSKANTRNFKCPYCPNDTAVAQCRQLYF